MTLFDDDFEPAVQESPSVASTSIKDLGKAPNIWVCTWNECLQVYANGGSLVSMEGHLIAGRDRKLEITGETRAREMYLHTLALAFQKGKEIPDHVKESESDFFESLQAA
jgi:hypothetical protein